MSFVRVEVVFLVGAIMLVIGWLGAVVYKLFPPNRDLPANYADKECIYVPDEHFHSGPIVDASPYTACTISPRSSYYVRKHNVFSVVPLYVKDICT